jgi:hypothetical protein
VQARALSADGIAGDWLPLGTLVRTPGFKELRCPHAVAKPCVLSGSNLFLATAIAATPTFENPIDVPADFTGTQLPVPHPSSGTLYVKLRDDPGTVQTLTLPVLPASALSLAPNRVAPAGSAPAGDADQSPSPESPATPKPEVPATNPVATPQAQQAVAPASTHS